MKVVSLFALLFALTSWSAESQRMFCEFPGCRNGNGIWMVKYPEGGTYVTIGGGSNGCVPYEFDLAFQEWGLLNNDTQMINTIDLVYETPGCEVTGAQFNEVKCGNSNNHYIGATEYIEEVNKPFQINAPVTIQLASKGEKNGMKWWEVTLEHEGKTPKTFGMYLTDCMYGAK